MNYTFRTYISVCLTVLMLIRVGSTSQMGATPRLLVFKQLLADKLVQKVDFMVKYSIFNVGNASASDAILVDHSFDSEFFQKIGGEYVARFRTIAAKTNVTHVVVFRPVLAGIFEFSGADVYYRSENNLNVQLRSLSSEIGRLKVFGQNYEQKWFTEWFSFAIVTLPSIAIPYALWYNSKQKYEKLFKYSKKLR